jgi:hypothetical protein
MLPATQIAQKNFLRGLSRSSMLKERDIRTGFLDFYKSTGGVKRKSFCLFRVVPWRLNYWISSFPHFL